MRRRAFLGLPLVATGARAGATAAAVAYPAVTTDVLAFPRDHGSHPAFRTEWWYVTGWLEDRQGGHVGVQVTFFRRRPGIAEDSASAFAPRQLIFAHAAIADAAFGRLRHDQRVARAVFDLAGAAEATTDVRVGGWSLALDGDTYVAKVAAREFAFELGFRASQPVLLQGESGYSRRGPLPAQASRYYSRPQLEVSGTLEVGGRARQLRGGRAWLDHEWSSEYLASDAVGWDWIGINLDDSGALMAFRMRDRGGKSLWAGGSRRDARGVDHALARDGIAFEPLRTWTSPRTGIAWPVEFRVRAGGTDYRIAPLMDDCELDSRLSTGTVYWEGAARMSSDGRPVGRGYLELTGYGGALRL